jgi:hypothetical protein
MRMPESDLPAETRCRREVSYVRDLLPEALASRKGVPGDRESEVSGTAKHCTDEQELHKRHS